VPIRKRRDVRRGSIHRRDPVVTTPATWPRPRLSHHPPSPSLRFLPARPPHQVRSRIVKLLTHDTYPHLLVLPSHRGAPGQIWPTRQARGPSATGGAVTTASGRTAGPGDALLGRGRGLSPPGPPLVPAERSTDRVTALPPKHAPAHPESSGATASLRPTGPREPGQLA
jgi:hypothetical protein